LQLSFIKKKLLKNMKLVMEFTSIALPRLITPGLYLEGAVIKR